MDSGRKGWKKRRGWKAVDEIACWYKMNGSLIK